MAEQNFPDRVLYNMDNLEVLRGMNDETVDLIATDPPFNKKRNRAASAGQYEDAWRWADDPSFQAERPDQWYWQPVHRIWLEQILDETPALYGAIESIRYASDEDTAAFMCFLGVRLLEMYRVLKPTGSLYLHCDHSAGTYIGMVLRSFSAMTICGAKSPGGAPTPKGWPFGATPTITIPFSGFPRATSTLSTQSIGLATRNMCGKPTAILNRKPAGVMRLTTLPIRTKNAPT